MLPGCSQNAPRRLPDGSGVPKVFPGCSQGGARASQCAPRKLPGSSQGGSGAHMVLSGCSQRAPMVLAWRPPGTCKTFKKHWFLQCFRGVASQVVSFGFLGSPRVLPGCSQGAPMVVSGWSQAVLRKLPGGSQVALVQLGSSQSAPRVLPECLGALPGCCQSVSGRSQGAGRALPGRSQSAPRTLGCSQDAPIMFPGGSQVAPRELIGLSYIENWPRSGTLISPSACIVRAYVMKLCKWFAVNVCQDLVLSHRRILEFVLGGFRV